jgi:hypothetical protein
LQSAPTLFQCSQHTAFYPFVHGQMDGSANKTMNAGQAYGIHRR